jgi:hypothetical protein
MRGRSRERRGGVLIMGAPVVAIPSSVFLVGSELSGVPPFTVNVYDSTTKQEGLWRIADG